MSTIDFTTLYSTEAAIDLKPGALLDAKNRWFVTSLASTTASLLFDSSLRIFVPPSSIETRRRLPAFVPSLNVQFPDLIHDAESSEPDRLAAIDLVNEFCLKDDVFQPLKALAVDSEYWSSPHVSAWLQWHLRNELESHTGVLDGQIGSIEFDPIIKNLQIRDRLLHFAMDTIVRGFYYYSLVPDKIWLHPVRIEKMPLTADSRSVEIVPLDSDLLAFAIGAIESKKRLFRKSDPHAEFSRILRTVREITGGRSAPLEENIKDKLARELRLSWGATTVREASAALREVLPLLSILYDVAAEKPAERVVSGVLQTLAHYYPKLDSWVESKAEQLDRRGSRRVTTKGKRILSIVNRS